MVAKKLLGSCSVLLTVGLPCLSWGQTVADPGFETPITFDGAPFVGSWEGFNGGGATAANSTVMPHSGQQHLALTIDNTNDTFAGAFQDIPGLVAGTPFTFSGWHKAASDPLDVGVEVRIEWRNSASNSEVARTPNSLPVPTSDYTQFALTADVPANADVARIVYAIQTFNNDGPTNSGTVYVDDILVPEPHAVATLLISVLALSGACRRK